MAHPPRRPRHPAPAPATTTAATPATGTPLPACAGSSASHELITHLLSLGGRRTVLLTCGWMITRADEQAIGLLPATAWQAAVDQDGLVREDKHIAEITHLMTRAAGTLRPERSPLAAQSEPVPPRAHRASTATGRAPVSPLSPPKPAQQDQ